MRKSPLGLFAGRVLTTKKKKQRWAISTYKRRKLGIDKKADPLGGAPQGRGIVLEKVGIAQNNQTLLLENVFEFN